jgi:hypothetical protein
MDTDGAVVEGRAADRDGWESGGLGARRLDVTFGRAVHVEGWTWRPGRREAAPYRVGRRRWTEPLRCRLVVVHH